MIIENKELVSIYYLINHKNNTINKEVINNLSGNSRRVYIISFGDISTNYYLPENVTLLPYSNNCTLNNIIATESTSDIFIIENLVYPEQTNFLTDLNKKAYSGERQSICGGSLIMNFSQNTVISKIVLGLGRNIVSRFGSFVTRSYNNYGGPLKLTEDDNVLSSDSLAGTFIYIPRDIINILGGFDENLSYPQISQTMIDDFCLRARANGIPVNTLPGITATVADPSERTDLANEAKEVICKYWEAKWGWNPDCPDLTTIRNKWKDSPLCKNITDDLEDNIQTEQPSIDILIVTMNSQVLLKNCIESILNNDYPNIKIYILNNGSTDTTQSYCELIRNNKTFPIFIENLPVNIGVPAAMNWLVKISDSPLVARFDDDIVIERDCIKRLVDDILKEKHIGAVMPKILCNSEGKMTVQYAGNYATDSDDPSFNNYKAKVSTAGGPILLYRRKALNKAGAFDIAFSPSQIEDLDHAIKVWECGYDIVYDGTIAVHHFINSQNKVSYQRIICDSNNFENMITKHGKDWYYKIKPKEHSIIDY